MVMCVLWFINENENLGTQEAKYLYWTNTKRDQFTIHYKVETIHCSIVTGLSSSRKLFKVFIFSFLYVWTFWHFPSRFSCYQTSNSVTILLKAATEVFSKKLYKIHRRHLCRSLYFNKFGGLWLVTLLKYRFWHTCFPVNFAKFLEAPFIEHFLATASVLCKTGKPLFILFGQKTQCSKKLASWNDLF